MEEEEIVVEEEIGEMEDLEGGETEEMDLDDSHDSSGLPGLDESKDSSDLPRRDLAAVTEQMTRER